VPAAAALQADYGAEVIKIEHGDAILESLGLDWDTIIDLKVRGVVP
jgi:hypothetical protein